MERFQGTRSDLVYLFSPIFLREILNTTLTVDPNHDWFYDRGTVGLPHSRFDTSRNSNFCNNVSPSFTPTVSFLPRGVHGTFITPLSDIPPHLDPNLQWRR